ncbi:TniB family NTP-binding protein [Agrobacterium pusense]|uniref:TniB family NTP-binding protein n=1 Tax=Agrobacterium pusense TaxID=648995 RepID=UPI003FD606B4
MFHTEAFLTPEARAAAAALPKPRRQEMIKTLLYKYPVFKQGVKFIEDFHRPAGGEGHDTGAIGALMGESHAGKSMICRYYASLFPKGVGEGGETYPVVYLEATENMTTVHMAERLYYLTGARSIPKIKSGALIDNSILRLAAATTRLVILDESQLLLTGRPMPQIKAFRGFIKQMVDARMFNVLLVGEETLHETVHSMKALANRGFYTETVEPMGDRGTEFEMFRLLIDKIDERLPFLSKSNLEVWAKDFHHFSGGKIGRVMGLLARAGQLSMGQGSGCIMVEQLRETVNRMRAPGDRYPYFEKG